MIQFCDFFFLNYPIQSRSYQIIPRGRKVSLSMLRITLSFGALVIGMVQQIM